MGVIQVASSEVGGGAGARLRSELDHDVRRFAAATAAGAIAGFVAGGIGSRLAMMVIAALNRDMTGRLTDDGAIMGRFDLGETAGLVLFTTALGVLGGLVYLAVRDLRIGPPWFQRASIIAGPAVVVGAMLVHRDGIDFTLLEPAALSIALFVAVPALFSALVSPLADRWLAPGAWLGRAPTWAVLLVVLPVAVLWPLGVVAVAAWGARRAVLAWPPARDRWLHPARRWLVRGLLVAVFLVALQNLVAETISLV